MGMIKIVIVHYNTPRLTGALVKSIRKFVKKDYHIYIFDNSDTEPFDEVADDITVWDNTHGRYIYFDGWLRRFKMKKQPHETLNNYGTAKHTYSVDKCMELVDDGFILLDSDVLLKQDISVLADTDYYAVGEIARCGYTDRLVPYVCFINVRKCKGKGVHYFDARRTIGLGVGKGGYDTGASFLEDVRMVGNIKEIKVEDYVEHFYQGSWNKKKDCRQEEEWLKINRDLYE